MSTAIPFDKGKQLQILLRECLMLHANHSAVVGIFQNRISIWEVFSSSPSSTLRKEQNNRNFFHSEKSMSLFYSLFYRAGSSPRRGITLKSSTRKKEVKAGKLSTNVCKCTLECQLIVLAGNPGTALAQSMLKSGSQEGQAEADTVCSILLLVVVFGWLFFVYCTMCFSIFFLCKASKVMGFGNSIDSGLLNREISYGFRGHKNIHFQDI